MKKLQNIGLVALLCGTFVACGDDSSTSANDAATSSDSSALLSSGDALSAEGAAASSSSSTEAVANSSDDGAPASSANEGASSSSVATSSAAESSVSALPANYDPETGILTDERDGETYKTAKIGNQIWMAQNLNIAIADWDVEFEKNIGYEYATECPKSSTEDDCNQYGRLYSQIGFLLSFNNADVYDKYPAVSEDLRPFQGVCPSGWHIPSVDEWQTLLNEEYLQNLLSVEDGGTNESGFNVRIIGFAFYNDSGLTYETYDGFDSTSTIFATVDQPSDYQIYGINFQKNYVGTYRGEKNSHYSVRCLMN